MLKKLCSAALSALLLQAAIVPAFAKSSAEKDAERAAKVRAQITKLGTGKDARVKLELRDKTKLEGYLSETGDTRFAVTDASGKTTTVAYSQVKKAQGNNLSTGAKIAIGVGIAVAVVVTFILLYPYILGY